MRPSATHTVTREPDASRTPAAQRQRTARVLARTDVAELAEAWRTWPRRPEVEYLREPEAGLVMVQARTGGTGDRFHLGEATVTRATVLLRGSPGQAPGQGGFESTGTAYVLGSRPEHAALAAIFDGLLSSPRRSETMSRVIEPLERALREADTAAHDAARSTVVDFFTVARENDGEEGEDEE